MNTSPPLPQRSPPRFVPTLTEVVQVPLQTGAPLHDDVLSLEKQEILIHRVMQRVDAIVSRRLSDALADLVAAHTALLEPLLRQEIEVVVRESVSIAIAQELVERSEGRST